MSLFLLIEAVILYGDNRESVRGVTEQVLSNDYDSSIMLDVGGLMLGIIVAFSLGFLMCRYLCSRGWVSWGGKREDRNSERVMSRLTSRERLGILLTVLPRPVVECYLETVSPQEAESAARIMARYTRDGVGELGDRLLQAAAANVLCQLSEDVPDLVVHLVFQPEPISEEAVIPSNQAFHLVASHIGQAVEDEHIRVYRAPSRE